MTKAAASDHGLGWPQEMTRRGAWLAEIAISSFKRLFGDSVRAVWRYVVQEMTLKVDLYNKLLQVKREVIACVGRVPVCNHRYMGGGCGGYAIN